MRHSKVILGTTEGQHAPAVPLYSLPLRSKREPRHFTFIFLSLVLRRYHGDQRREGVVLLNVHRSGHADGGALPDRRDDLQ